MRSPAHSKFSKTKNKSASVTTLLRVCTAIEAHQLARLDRLSAKKLIQFSICKHRNAPGEQCFARKALILSNIAHCSNFPEQQWTDSSRGALDKLSTRTAPVTVCINIAQQEPVSDHALLMYTERTFYTVGSFNVKLSWCKAHSEDTRRCTVQCSALCERTHLCIYCTILVL